MSASSGPTAGPGYWLRRASSRWTTLMDRRLAPLGLTHTQFELLGAVNWLSRGQGGVTQQEVSDFAGADRATTSRVLRVLEERGLVERAPHRDSARALSVRTTGAGAELAVRAASHVKDVDAALFGNLEERLQAAATLRTAVEREDGA